MNDLLKIDLANPRIYKEKVWGDSHVIADLVGRDVAEFGDRVIGEVFLASTHPDGPSLFADGRSFDQVITEEPTAFGDAITPKKKFPLLLKALSATEYLSIQTHYKNKVEAWVTLSDGQMLYGLTKKGEETVLTEEGRQELSEKLAVTKEPEELSKYFNLVTFKENELYMIPAGTVHALLSGTVYEPQKNANLTMRGGDWGRNDPNRQLHLDDFYASMYPFAFEPKPIERMYKVDEKDVKHAVLMVTTDFAVDEIIVAGGTRTIETFEDRFFVVMITDGEVTAEGGSTCETFTAGEVFVLAAKPQPWTFHGNGRMLLTYVPDMQKGVIDPLLEAGYDLAEITRLGGPVKKENDLYIYMKEKKLL